MFEKVRYSTDGVATEMWEKWHKDKENRTEYQKPVVTTLCNKIKKVSTQKNKCSQL
jgi:hypothetical protein